MPRGRASWGRGRDAWGRGGGCLEGEIVRGERYMGEGISEGRRVPRGRDS